MRKRKNCMVIIPRGMVVMPEEDPIRVRLEWRMGLVKLRLQSKKEDCNGSKKKS